MGVGVLLNFGGLYKSLFLCECAGSQPLGQGTQQERRGAMEPEAQRKIEETLIDILKTADMDVMTEFKVRNMAAQKLGINLSAPERKQFVRDVVESFLLSIEEEPVPLATSAAAAAMGPEGEATTATTPEGEAAIATEPVGEAAGAEEETKEAVQEIVETKSNISAKGKEIDDYGDPVICKLSDKRRVTVQDFRGKTLVSIREYYEKDGKQLPSSKGISLTTEQWKAFSTSVPAIEEAIKKMESRLN